MKTYCQDIDIEDPQQIAPFILNCFNGNGGTDSRKWNVEKFKKFVCEALHMPIEEYEKGVASQDYNFKASVADQLAVIVTDKIKSRNLELRPIRFFDHIDGISMKQRKIGIETPMQQVMVYVAIGAMMPMLEAKICPYQCASISGRGQVYGKNTIEKWIRKDTSRKYWAKADIRKCFPSIKKEVVMKLLKRDIHKNKVLLWFVDSLLSTYVEKDKNVDYHECGLIIGSYLSQWLCNYVLSYLYRYIDTLTKTRHGRNGITSEIRLIKHVLFYMDDILVIGNRKADIKICMKKAKEWAKKNLGLDFKDGYNVVTNIYHKKIDMMGYIVGIKCTTVRKSIFRRIRRQFLRAWRYYKKNKHLTLKRARSVISYFGFIKYTNSFHFVKKMKVSKLFERAKSDVSYYAKINIYYNRFDCLGNTVIYVA